MSSISNSLESYIESVNSGQYFKAGCSKICKVVGDALSAIASWFSRSKSAEVIGFDDSFNKYKMTSTDHLEILQEKALGGDINSMLKLARYNEEKAKNSKNPTLARHSAFLWYKMAAEKGSSFAKMQLVQFHDSEQGERTNALFNQAFEECEKQAKKGNAEAMVKAGYCYANGIGVERSVHSAHCWYKEASQDKNVTKISAEGLIILALAFEKGNAITPAKPDLKKAKELLVRAAYAKSIDAHFHLGRLADQEKSISLAWNEYLIAARKGHVEANYHLARLLDRDDETTIGVNFKMDCLDAVWKYYESAAKTGHVEAIYRLGLCWERLANGCSFGNITPPQVHVCLSRARGLYEKAAAAGNSAAKYRLGLIHERRGDFERAYRYFLEADTIPGAVLKRAEYLRRGIGYTGGPDAHLAVICEAHAHRLLGDTAMTFYYETLASS